MKKFVVAAGFLFATSSFGGHLTIINNTGVPTQLKINKCRNLVDVSSKENHFEFSDLATLRFFSKCDHLETRSSGSQEFQNFTEHFDESRIDIYDLDNKIMFFQCN